VLLILKTERACQAIEARKSWAKFGQAAGKIGLEANVTNEAKEDVLIEDPDEEKNLESQIVQQLRKGVIKGGRKKEGMSA